MTPEEFISALDAWSATGGKFRDSVPDDHKVTTPAEAEAVCRGLDSPHIYEVNSIGRPALSELVHFFQTVSTRSAGQVLATEGLVRLRRIFRNALDRPFEPDLQEYKYREPYDSCAFILKVLAMYGTRGDGSLILKGARDLRVAEQGLWSVILYYLEKEHPEATDVFEALREPLPEAWAGLCYLEWANRVAEKQPLSQHPFNSRAGIARLAEYLTNPEPESWVEASCAVAAVPFVDPGARETLFDSADRHPRPQVRLEAAAARARTGSELGAQRLAELCLDPRLADGAIEHLEKLGLAAHIPAEARDPGFRAMAEMCTWLSDPNEQGRAPDEIVEYDTRVLNWPPTGDRRQLWIFKYRYEPDADRDEAEEDVGLVGSITFSLFFVTSADMKPEEIYALHCCWELQTRGDPGAPKEISAAYGRKMLTKANRGFGGA
jgi:hypothetical protein